VSKSGPESVLNCCFNLVGRGLPGAKTDSGDKIAIIKLESPIQSHDWRINVWNINTAS
jgi:hypothetical protein